MPTFATADSPLSADSSPAPLATADSVGLVLVAEAVKEPDPVVGSLPPAAEAPLAPADGVGLGVASGDDRLRPADDESIPAMGCAIAPEVQYPVRYALAAAMSEALHFVTMHAEYEVVSA
jgi:hypothetical protein